MLYKWQFLLWLVMAEIEQFGRSQTCPGGMAMCSAEEAGVGDGEAGSCCFHAVVGM